MRRPPSTGVAEPDDVPVFLAAGLASCYDSFRATPVITFQQLTLQDEHLVDAMFGKLQSYSWMTDGLPKPTGVARDFLESLPTGCTADQKHSLLASIGGKPAALIDLIAFYPTPRGAFIGLFAVDDSRQRSGLGTRIFYALEDYCRSALKVEVLSLAVATHNPARRFWKKMGFVETGRERNYHCEVRSGTLAVMDKHLSFGADGQR
ncbi:Acetyltransferase (GNAT) family protein [compost metagenome]